jgi:predicted nucleotidyltransferase component of viral defense system
MLEPAELAHVTAVFGVSEDQVRRDHLISHAIRALAQLNTPLVFFGGTALSRVWLTHPETSGRLSEDIDLYTSDRRSAAAVLHEGLPRLLRREFPRTIWDPALSEVRAVDPARLVTGDGIQVRIQLLSTTEHRELGAWPTEVRPVLMRYSDVPEVSFRVPTLTSFAAMKTVAWMDRAAARDLYDLAALARLGSLTVDVADLVREVTGWTVAPHAFARLTSLDWSLQLGHQTSDLPSAEQCLALVRASYADALGWHRDPE